MSGAPSRDTRCIKGTAFLSKQRQVIADFGEKRWGRFVEELAAKEPFFGQPILASTLIPWRPFLFFQDEMLAEFFSGDEKAYWIIGARSAEWALLEGPYKHFLVGREMSAYVDAIPRMSRGYFTFGDYAADLVGNVVRCAAKGLPVWHAYFEFMVMGFHKRAFELLGARVAARCLTPPRSKDFRYEFDLLR